MPESFITLNCEKSGNSYFQNFCYSVQFVEQNLQYILKQSNGNFVNPKGRISIGRYSFYDKTTNFPDEVLEMVNNLQKIE